MKTFVLTAVASLFTTNAMAQQTPTLSADNINAVLQAMTLQEKARLLVGSARDFFGETAVVGGSADRVPGAAGSTAAIPRLGIPATMLTDGPAGVRINPTRKGTTQTFYATGFPIGSCLASSWNQELLRRVGVAIGEETMEYGCDVILGPGLNLHRNPLCGRNFEYFSEDPLVTGKMAAAYINGVQSKGVGTSAKHYAVNSQETDRTSVDERLSARAARELYLRGFEIAVRESQPWTVMSSYNSVNGQYSMGNHDLLTKILRDDWGFKGIVMTDWIGIRGGLRTADEVTAGNDLLEPGQKEQAEQIIAAVEKGELSMADVDRNVRRMLEYIVKTPSFRHYAFTDKPDLTGHAALAREAATEGIVLMKNSGTLPLTVKKDGSNVTVALFGVCSYHMLSGGTGSGRVHTPYITDMVEGLKNAGIGTTKMLTDVYNKYVPYARAKFQADNHTGEWYLQDAWGDQKLQEMPIGRRMIEHEVKEADVAIITLGRQAGEGVDRDAEREFFLQADEQELIKNVSEVFHAAGKPVVVVINSGSVIETASWRDRVDAIVLAWEPGEEAGNAIADVLTGKVNPSGKLTMTWPVSVYDHASSRHFPSRNKVSNHEEDIYVGYRYFDTFGKDVSYPFGYGMSYTTFEYSKPSVKVSGDNITVSVTVKNTGSVSGKEIAQVYVSAPAGQLEKP
ncbi:MAG: glycoside hydrolase family 3 protein, partial [Prevotella sp.]|nr:glycoside hydrolase family 3 protein [Prevotella sp.]